MIKSILFTATLVLSICPQLYSMNMDMQESPNQFTIQTNDYNVRFRRVDLHNLSEQDHQKLMAHFGDFDAFQSMFGRAIAIAFKTVHLVSPETVLNIYIEEYERRFEKMPSDQKIMYHWILENTENDDFIGHFAISTYVSTRPQEYNNSLMLEMGGVATGNYRNKNIESELRPVVQKIALWAPFNDGIFCASIPSDNEYLQNLAQKNNQELILSHDREINFGLFTKNIPIDLFVISRESK